jgi:actin-related protein
MIQTYPVTNGRTIENAITRVNYGGQDLTKHLADLLRENG